MNFVVDTEYTIFDYTDPADAYPANDYTIVTPEDPVFFASQRVEPGAPTREDPTVKPSVFVNSVAPIPVAQAEGLSDAFASTDPNGAVLPPSLTVDSISPSVGLPFEGGTLCTITGTSLGLVNEVRMNGKLIPFVYVNATTLQITAPVPPDNTGGVKQIDVFDAFSVLQGSVSVTYNAQVSVFGVSSVVPSAGSMLGGDVITVLGSAFFFIADVRIGGESVQSFEIVDSNTLRVVTIAGVAGTKDIEVESFDAVAALPNSFTYTYPPPFILGLDRNSGDISGGTEVQISGAYFDGATDVLVGGVSAGAFALLDDKTIVFQTAPAIFTGIALDVTVVTPVGSNTLVGAFTYSTTLPVPRITSVSPPLGLIGSFQAVTIVGSGFTGVVQVEFDGVAANSFTVVSDTRITCTAPFGSYNGGNAVPVTVTSMDGSFTRAGAFTFVYDVPTVVSTTLTTDSVSGGASGTLYGTNFYEVSDVTVAGVPVRSFVVVSPTQIDYVTGTSPNAAVGDIQVITAFGLASLPGVFTYTVPTLILSSSSKSGGFANGGLTVVLTGTGFALITQVRIAGVIVSSYTVDSETQITCVTGSNSTPSGVPESILVQTVFGQAELSNAFTYYATMSLVSTSLTTGVTLGGENGTLTGTNFGNNIQNIFLVGTAVSSFTVVNSSTITFVTGQTNTYGLQGDIVILTTFGENVVLPNAFVYYPSLTISGVNISKGLTTGGESRTLTGTGFTTVTAVTVCGVPVTSFVAASLTSLTFVTAPNLTNGTGDIVLTTPFETATLSGFTYYPSMQLTSVSTSTGPATGGTTVVITGGGFFDVNSVKLNGTEVSSFTVDSLTQITCVTASKVLLDGETGDVLVASPHTSATLPNGWTYWPTLLVNSTDVTNGSTVGGTTVVITGSGFYGVTSVFFNNVNATFTVDSNTQITVMTGAGSGNGTGDIVVNSIYTSGTLTNGWTYWQPVVVSSLNVTNGTYSGGTTVVVTGSGFFAVTDVRFNGASVASFTVNSLTQITVVTASKSITDGDVGAVVVTTTYTSGTKSNAWTYWPAMSVSSLSVSNGSTQGGTTVVITGAGFFAVSNVSFINFNVTSFTVNSSTQITVTTRSGVVAETGNVVVTSTYTSATLTNGWTYWRPVSIYNQSVSSGVYTGGTTVVINGSDFDSVTSVVFAGVPVASYVVNAGKTQITVVTAPKSITSLSVGNVVVTTTYTQAVNTNGWTYWLPMTITSVSVSNGTTAGGTNVVIMGTNIDYLTSITLNGVAAASFVRFSSQEIRLTTGVASAIGTGDIVVTSSYTSVTSTNGWTYWNPVVVSSLDVTNGTYNGGTTVVVTGSGFDGVTGVTFNGVAVTSYTVDSATQITVVTASKSITNTDVGNVVVTTTYTSGSKSNAWTYWLPLSVTLSVSNGPTTGGTTVVITGTNFTGVTNVSFGGVSAASFTVDSVTQITAVTDVSSITSPTLGNVVVTTSGLEGTAANVWTYYPPVVVSILDVSYGPVSGGTTVNITGTGFYNLNSVKLKNVEVRSYTVNSSTSITAVVKGDVTQFLSSNSYMGTSAPTVDLMEGDTVHCWAGGTMQMFVVPGTCVYTSKDAVKFTVANVPTPGSYRFAMYVPSLSKAYVIGSGNLANRLIESSDGVTWTSPGVLPVNQSWNWAAYSPTLDTFVVVNRPSADVSTPFAVSTDRGATWNLYGTSNNRSFATVVWCAAMGKFVASGWTSGANPDIVAYSSDGTTWTEVDLAAQFPTADTKLNQSVGMSEDLGVVVYSSATDFFVYNGTTWQTASGGGVFGIEWIASLQLFVGLKKDASNSYAYSSDGLTWTTVATNNTGVVGSGALTYARELDILFSSGSGKSYVFTNPAVSTGDVVVTTTYTSGTKSNAWSFVPTLAVSDVDVGFGPTAGGTSFKVYGRGFRGTSVTLKGVQAASVTVDPDGCVMTVTSAAGTAGTGDVVCANAFRTATLTNGWSYKNVSVSSYVLDSLTSGARASVKVVLNTKPVLSTYTGPLFRVWRASDGSVTDVYGTSSDSATWFTKNGVSVSTFKGSSSLRVLRWFDQSGNTSGSDVEVVKPPNAGNVFAYMYQPANMPVLDLTNRLVDFNNGSCFMQVQDGIVTGGDVSHTITFRQGTTGNSTSGEYFNIGVNSASAPGDGNYLRRVGSDYVNTWPGNNVLTLTGAYGVNQTVTFVYDQAAVLRTGFVGGASSGTSSVTTPFTGGTASFTIGGRGTGATDSLATMFFFHYASSSFSTADQNVFEDADAFATPAVKSLSVSSGSTAGGTTVVVTGVALTNVTGVSFNGVAAASFTVNSATQITAVTAAGSAGRGDVVLTAPTGAITFTRGWTYASSNYTRYFSVTDISSSLGKSGSSWLTTVVYSSALNLFVVADSNGGGITNPYVTSSDGTTWTRQTAPAVGGNNTILDIAASPTAIVSVGVLPTVRRSTNATSWSNITGSLNQPFRICYSPALSRWAIGRADNLGLYYSNDDGVNWSTASGAPVFVSNVLWNSTLNKFFVFIRNGGSVYSSSDGISYSLAANNVFGYDNYHAAAHSSDRGEMMTIGNNTPNVYTSTDGTTWTQKTSITGRMVVGVTWSSALAMYVACTNRGLYVTVDGSRWLAMNLMTWSGTFDYSWGRWDYSPSAGVGVAAYCNYVFRSNNTTRSSFNIQSGQNVQVSNDADLRPGTGDFTVEWFQFQPTPTGVPTTPYVFSIGNDLAVSVNKTTGVMSVFVGGSAVITTTPTDLYERWCHLAVTRVGTTLGLFKDGARLVTVVNSTNIANSTDVLRIGNSSTTSSANQYIGRVTNFHFVNGTALYTTVTYTVPTREIFPMSNSKLLLPVPTGNITANFSGVSKTVTSNSVVGSTDNPFYL
jgi:hypothetical protein